MIRQSRVHAQATAIDFGVETSMHRRQLLDQLNGHAPADPDEEGKLRRIISFVETNPRTGLARRAAPLITGATLEPRWPV